MFSVALIGPDGCGKTTVATQLSESLPWPTTYVYMGVSLESSNRLLITSRAKLAMKRWLGKSADTAGPRDPSRQRPKSKSPLKRALRFGKLTVRLANQFAEETFRQRIVAREVRRGNIVLTDRDFFCDYYTYDILQSSDRSWHQRVHGWLLTHCYRKPDLVIYLDVSGATMFARKGEGTVELLDRRRDDYKSLKSVLPSFAVISGDQPLADVVAQVRDKIVDFAKQRRRPSDQLVAQSGKPPAIVIGADCVTGLQTARTLHKLNIPTIGLAKKLRHYCCRSRFYRRLIGCDISRIELIEQLERLGPGFDEPPVLFPCTDLSVLLISQHRDRLSRWYRYALPAHETIEMFTDKVLFSRYATERNLPYPRTSVVDSSSHVEQLADELIYPCYVKPPVKTPAWETQVGHKVIVVRDAGEFRRVALEGLRWVPSLLVQQAVQGAPSNHYTCNAYFDRRHQMVACFSSRKLRQWPIETGTGCLSEECDDPVIAEICRHVFADVAFHGPAYVDLKRDARDGQLYVIETNVGRPTGRSAAAAASGVNFIAAMYSDLVTPQPIAKQQSLTSAGRKWIHLRRDLQAAFLQMYRGELSPRDWLRSLRGKKSYAVFAWDDPGPSLAEFTTHASRIVRNLTRRIKPRAKPPVARNEGEAVDWQPNAGRQPTNATPPHAR